MNNQDRRRQVDKAHKIAVIVANNSKLAFADRMTLQNEVKDLARNLQGYNVDTGLSNKNYEEIADFLCDVRKGISYVDRRQLADRLSPVVECDPKLSVWYDHEKGRMLTLRERKQFDKDFEKLKKA